MAARAQQQDAVRRIGVLAENDANMIARLAALRQGLARRGWSEGRNIRIDYRYDLPGPMHRRSRKSLSHRSPM